jgi:Cu(I)/Ag(I) efflux system protein CusF
MRTVAYALAISLAIGTSAVAQTAPSDDHDNHHPPPIAMADPEVPMTEGEVRKVDRAAQKVTLRHGPISKLEMPEMTMVFRVAEPKMLEGLDAKKKVRFTAERIGGQITLTSLELVE